MSSSTRHRRAASSKGSWPGAAPLLRPGVADLSCRLTAGSARRFVAGRDGRRRRVRPAASFPRRLRVNGGNGSTRADTDAEADSVAEGSPRASTRTCDARIAEAIEELEARCRPETRDGPPSGRRPPWPITSEPLTAGDAVPLRDPEGDGAAAVGVGRRIRAAHRSSRRPVHRGDLHRGRPGHLYRRSAAAWRR